MNEYLCFDIGGTKVKHAVVQEDGIITAYGNFQTKAHLGIDYILPQLIEVAEKIKACNDVKGICVSTSGMVDVFEGRLLDGKRMLFKNYSGIGLKGILEEKTGLRTEVENDVNCALLAEDWLGAAKGYRNSVCITVGTGIGGALMLDGRLYRGSHFQAMEVGLMPILFSNYENFASTRALVYEYAKVNNMPMEQLDGVKIMERVKDGEEAANKVFDTMCSFMAQGIASIVHMLAPDVFIIGGAITDSGEWFLERLNPYLVKFVDKRFYKNTLFKLTQLENRAGVIGALRHFMLMSEFRSTS